MSKGEDKSNTESVSYLAEILFLLGNERKKIPNLIIVFVLMSSLDLFGLGLIIPFVSFLSNASEMNLVVQKISSFFGVVTERNFVIQIFSLLLMAVFFVKTIAILYINKKIISYSNFQMVNIRKLLINSYQRLDFIDYTNKNSADFVYNLQTLSTHFANSITLPLLRILSEGIVTLVIIGFLFWVSPTAMIVMLIVFGLFSYSYLKFFRSKLKFYGENVNSSNAKSVKAVTEAMKGFNEIRVLGKSSYFANIISEESLNVASNSQKAQLITIAPRTLFEFILVSFAIVMILYTLNTEGSLDGLMPIIAVFGAASVRLLPIINNLINSLSLLRIGRNSVSRLYKDIKQLDSKKLITIKEHNSISNSNFESFELKNVSFTFNERKNIILDDISLKINPGDSIGIMGPSGSGKSTLLNLLLGNIKPSSGEVFFNNELLHQKIHNWRSHIAFIPQQIFILDDSIKRNIALGQDDNQIDIEKIHKALFKARLDDAISNMPEGINTILGEGGVRLSGGQRQRIALARAFYYERDILILDESTSALDNKTEKEIVREINQLKGDITIIIVAHRLSTLESCNKVFQLENGKLTN